MRFVETSVFTAAIKSLLPEEENRGLHLRRLVEEELT